MTLLEIQKINYTPVHHKAEYKSQQGLAEIGRKQFLQIHIILLLLIY